MDGFVNAGRMCPHKNEARIGQALAARRRSLLRSALLVRPVLLNWCPDSLSNPPRLPRENPQNAMHSADFYVCVGKDSNLRRPKPTGLQPVVIDHSTTDAWQDYTIISRLFQNKHHRVALPFLEEGESTVEVRKRDFRLKRINRLSVYGDAARLYEPARLSLRACKG